MTIPPSMNLHPTMDNPLASFEAMSTKTREPPPTATSAATNNANPSSSASQRKNIKYRPIARTAVKSDTSNIKWKETPSHLLATANQRQKINQLPRSVRWRLSLGILSVPLPEKSKRNRDSTITASMTAASNVPSKIQEEEPNNSQKNQDSPLLKSIENTNALRLRLQRSRYGELEKKHYWSSTIMGIADGGGMGGSGLDDSMEREGVGVHHVARGEDPLSSFLHNTGPNEGEGNKKRFGGKGKGVFGGKRMLSRGNDRGGNESFHDSMIDPEEEKSAACKGSRWSDFYSTREVLDVIEKDLNRLPSDHYTVYHEWRRKVQELKDWKAQQEERDRPKAEKVEEGAKEEQQSQQQQQPQPQQQSFGALKRWNTGATANNSALSKWKFAGRRSSAEIVIESNGSHLGAVDNNDAISQTTPASPTAEEEEERIRQQQEAERIEIGVSTKERAERLSRMLFVYAREHPELGYRQGMHEILSYILLVLEMDIAVQERQRWRTDLLSPMGMASKNVGGSFTAGSPSLPAGTKDSNTYQRRHSVAGVDSGGMAGVDSSGNVVVVRLLDPDFILHDVFSIFECIMTALAPAYDAIPSGDDATAAMLEVAKEERGESPMEAMTSSFISKIRYVARDEALYGHVLCMPVPPQLYFAKWVRLMFGREVAGGMKDVLRLWDAFLDLASVTASIDPQAEIPISMALMNVLKTAAASMILLIRDKLLKPTAAFDGTMTGEPDPNDGIGYLMNYPPVEDISILVQTISGLLVKERKLSKLSNPSQKSGHDELILNGDPQPLPTKYHNVSNVIEHPLQGMKEEIGSYEPWPRRASEDEEAISRTFRGIQPDPSPPTWEKDLDAWREKANSRADPEDIASLSSDDETDKSDLSSGHNNTRKPLERRPSFVLGDVAAGLFGLGPKTVTAAVVDMEDNEVPRQTTDDHPLYDDSMTSMPLRMKMAQSSENILQMFRLAGMKDEISPANEKQSKGKSDRRASTSSASLGRGMLSELKEDHNTINVFQATLRDEPRRKPRKAKKSQSFTMGTAVDDRYSDLIPEPSEDASTRDKDFDDASRASSGLHNSWHSTAGDSITKAKTNSASRSKLASIIMVDVDSMKDFGLNDAQSAKHSVSQNREVVSRKKSKELAMKLEKSVGTLMHHFNDRINSSEENSHMILGSGPIIPDTIWEAMADIDHVRKELLMQSAMESLRNSERSSFAWSRNSSFDELEESNV